MILTRRTFQRIALTVLSVCLMALLWPRLVKADYDRIEVGLDGFAIGDRGDHPRIQRTSSVSNDEVFLDESFVVEGGDRLSIELTAADLIVETGTSSREARVVVRGEGPDAAEEFERQRFSAVYSAGTLEVGSDPEETRRRDNVQASFTVTVTVPSRMDTDISLASGDATISDLVGYFELAAASGDVELATVQGPSISIELASGDLVAERLDGRVSVSTASGDIRIGRILGNIVDLNAASGDLHVAAIEADHVAASSASGDVEIGHVIGEANVSTTSGDISLYISDAAEVSTTSGTVRLRVPRRAGFDAELNSSDVDLDGALDFRGSSDERRMRGQIGGGGPRLVVHTLSGSIELNTE